MSAPIDANSVGPMFLTEALEAAVPNSEGIRMAVSSPEGVFVAVQLAPGKVIVRKVNTMSGRAGSRMDTGEWMEPLPEWLQKASWRPA